MITQVQQYMKPGLQLQTDRPTQSSQKREEKFENCTRINVSNNFERKILIHSLTFPLTIFPTDNCNNKEDLQVQGPCSKAPFLPTRG